VPLRKPDAHQLISEQQLADAVSKHDEIICAYYPSSSSQSVGDSSPLSSLPLVFIVIIVIITIE